MKNDGKVLNKARQLLKKWPRALQLLRRSPEALELLGDVYWLGRMLADVVRRRYQVPPATVAATVFALAYLLSPLDVVPDALPGGLMDDVLVLTQALQAVQEELSAYKAWVAAAEAYATT